MIKQEQLKAMLDRLEPWSADATDPRKLANGRIVRFVDWAKAAKAAGVRR